MGEKLKNVMPDWIKYLPLVLALMSAVFFYSESRHKTERSLELLTAMDVKLNSLVQADKDGLHERQENFRKLSLIEQRLGTVEVKVEGNNLEVRELHKRVNKR